jgi:hypothetical protein
VAEGIETRRHAEIARTLGATIAQGYLYGRPGVLPTGSRPTRAAVELLKEPPATDTRTPFEIVAAEPGVLLACFQEAGHFTPATRVRFGRLSARVALTGALGVGMPPTPAPGVRGAALHPGDPLRGRVGRDPGRAPLRRRPGGQGLRRRRPGRRPEVRLRHHPRPGAGRPAAQPLLDKLAPAS